MNCPFSGDELRGVIGDPDVDVVSRAATELYTNIKRVSWCVSGENDGAAWELIGQLQDGAWIYYAAKCDFTGFDCLAWCSGVVASKLDLFVDYGLSRYKRELLASGVSGGADTRCNKHTGTL